MVRGQSLCEELPQNGPNALAPLNHFHQVLKRFQRPYRPAPRVIKKAHRVVTRIQGRTPFVISLHEFLRLRMGLADAGPSRCAGALANLRENRMSHFLQRDAFVTGIANFVTGKHAEFAWPDRSEERRVGKEWRWRRWREQ